MQHELKDLQLEVAKLRAETKELQECLAAERLAREREQESAKTVLAELESVKKEGSSKQQEIHRQLDDLQSEVASLHTDHANLMTRYEKELSISQENARTIIAQANQETVQAQGAVEKLRREKEESDRELQKTIQSILSRAESELSSVNGTAAGMREEKEALQKQEAQLLAEISSLRNENEKMRKDYAALCTRMSDVVYTARQSEVFSLQAESAGSHAAKPESSTVGKSATAGSNSGNKYGSGRGKK